MLSKKLNSINSCACYKRGQAVVIYSGKEATRIKDVLYMVLVFRVKSVSVVCTLSAKTVMVRKAIGQEVFLTGIDLIFSYF